MRGVAPGARLHTEPTYSTSYTIARDKLLRDLAIEHYLHDPWYTIAFKSYSAVRLWVIGIQLDEFREASLASKARMLFISGTMSIIFLLFIVLVPWAFLGGRMTLKHTWLMLAFMAYCTVIYLPFTIQARYTVPVRFLMLMVLAMAVVALVVGPAGNRGPVART